MEEENDTLKLLNFFISNPTFIRNFLRRTCGYEEIDHKLLCKTNRGSFVKALVFVQAKARLIIITEG